MEYLRTRDQINFKNTDYRACKMGQVIMSLEPSLMTCLVLGFHTIERDN